ATRYCAVENGAGGFQQHLPRRTPLGGDAIYGYRNGYGSFNERRPWKLMSHAQEGMTMTIGYDKPLYVLPFDHRATFSKNMFGWQEPLTPEQTAEISAIKQVIYDAFKAAVAGGVPKDRAGILVDEQFGASILRDARKQGFIMACPAEKSGQDEFDFEYGADFAHHIEEFNPTFCKVLVRYNP